MTEPVLNETRSLYRYQLFGKAVLGIVLLNDYHFRLYDPEIQRTDDYYDGGRRHAGFVEKRHQ